MRSGANPIKRAASAMSLPAIGARVPREPKRYGDCESGTASYLSAAPRGSFEQDGEVLGGGLVERIAKAAV